MKIYKMTGNDILKEIAFSMYRLQRIESYFYIDLEKRCDYYLQPNDFEKYVSLMFYYDFSIEDFKNEIKGDILVFGDGDTNPDILAAIIKKIIQKNTECQIINIERDVPKEHEIPYKYEMGMKRIYVSYAEDIESLKRYIKRSNPTYDYKDIGLCVKTKLNAKNISYDFVDIF